MQESGIRGIGNQRNQASALSGVSRNHPINHFMIDMMRCTPGITFRATDARRAARFMACAVAAFSVRDESVSPKILSNSTLTSSANPSWSSVSAKIQSSTYSCCDSDCSASHSSVLRYLASKYAGLVLTECPNVALVDFRDSLPIHASSVALRMRTEAAGMHSRKPETFARQVAVDVDEHVFALIDIDQSRLGIDRHHPRENVGRDAVDQPESVP